MGAHQRRGVRFLEGRVRFRVRVLVV
jgi:hypothetical protein